MNTTELQIKSLDTGEVVRSIDVSGQTDRDVERIISGLLRQADTDRFYVAEVSA